MSYKPVSTTVGFEKRRTIFVFSVCRESDSQISSVSFIPRNEPKRANIFTFFVAAITLPSFAGLMSFMLLGFNGYLSASLILSGWMGSNFISG